jgi:hypothetical protein
VDVPSVKVLPHLVKEIEICNFQTGS